MEAWLVLLTALSSSLYAELIKLSCSYIFEAGHFWKMKGGKRRCMPSKQRPSFLTGEHRYYHGEQVCSVWFCGVNTPSTFWHLWCSIVLPAWTLLLLVKQLDGLFFQTTLSISFHVCIQLSSEFHANVQ